MYSGVRSGPALRSHGSRTWLENELKAAKQVIAKTSVLMEDLQGDTDVVDLTACGCSRKMKQQEKLVFTAPPVLVYVGDLSKEPFVVHQTLLAASSDFFAGAMSWDFKERRERKLELPSIDREDFSQYLWFLYSGRIDSTPQERTAASYEEEYRRLIHCYHAGDYLQDISFKDAIVDRIIENSKEFVAVERDSKKTTKPYLFGSLSSLVYSRTIPESPLRRLVVDQYVAHGSADTVSGHKTEAFDADFLRDLSIALLTNRSSPSKIKGPASATSTCVYHEHDNVGKRCYKDAT